jgi:hypothetical protein
MLIFSLALLSAVSEREDVGVRVARSIPQSLSLRMLVFPFYTGAANGIVFYVVMILLTLMVLWGIYTWEELRGIGAGWSSQDMAETAVQLAAIALYALSYALSASLLRRWFFPTQIRQSNTWCLAILLMALLSALPPILVMVFCGTSSDQIELSLIGNPFAISFSSSQSKLMQRLILVVVWFALVGSLHISWLAARIRNFRPAPAAASQSQNKIA